MILEIYPRAAPDWAKAIEAAMPAQGIEGALRVAAYLATLAVESGGFRRFEEDLNYSAERLCAVWPRRFPTIADAEPYAYQPRALANLVYGGRNGNTDSDDGWNYRGRGPIQTTGKRNYARQGAALGLPLLANPSLLAQPEVGSRGSAWQWNADGCHELADQADLQGVRRRINGGLTGFDEFVAAYHRFLEA